MLTQLPFRGWAAIQVKLDENKPRSFSVTNTFSSNPLGNKSSHYCSVDEKRTIVLLLWAAQGFWNIYSVWKLLLPVVKAISLVTRIIRCEFSKLQVLPLYPKTFNSELDFRSIQVFSNPHLHLCFRFCVISCSFQLSMQIKVWTKRLSISTIAATQDSIEVRFTVLREIHVLLFSERNALDI